MLKQLLQRVLLLTGQVIKVCERNQLILNLDAKLNNVLTDVHFVFELVLCARQYFIQQHILDFPYLPVLDVKQKFIYSSHGFPKS